MDELNRYLEIIRSESDRGAVLVAHALLETSLQELVNATFVERRHNKALFKHPGPLSSAYSLEMVGVSLGLLSEQEQKDLETVRLVRNKFAHSIDMGFEDPGVVALCERLSHSASLGLKMYLGGERFTSEYP